MFGVGSVDCSYRNKGRVWGCTNVSPSQFFSAPFSSAWWLSASSWDAILASSQSFVIVKPQLTQLCIVLKTWSHSQGGGRMVFVIPGSRAGTVQLMLLNLLQAVVIMADISLLRVTKPREGTCARPPWFIHCQAVHCWDDHWACQRWALESLRSEWEQYGHTLKCLGKNQSCLPETLIRMVLRRRRNINSQTIGRKPWKRRKAVATTCSWLKANQALVLLQVLPVWCLPLPLWECTRALCALDLHGWIWKFKPLNFARFALHVNIKNALPTIMQPDQTFTRLLTRIIRNFLCTLFF